MKILDRHETGYIPELADGFDPSFSSEGGLDVRSFFIDAPESGVYRLQFSLRARADVPALFVFAGRKGLCWHGSLKSGEVLQKHIYLFVSEIIPRYHADAKPVEKLCLSTACADAESLEILHLTAEKQNGVPAVFLAGDSTVTDQTCGVPYLPEDCYSSWGQNLGYFIGEAAAVNNQAHCGLTTESFRQEGHFSILEKNLRPGDFCLFQFAHNDQKLAHLQAHNGYPENLRQYVVEIRRLGGIPVLVTPLSRNIWKADGEFLDLLGEHAAAVHRVGQETGAPVIDLHAFSTNLIRQNGFEACRDYFHPGDATHTNEYGSYLFAEFIAKELARIERRFRFDTAKIPPLLPRDSVWEARASGKAAQSKTAEQKEQFDAMEKSIENLLAVIEKARRESGL